MIIFISVGVLILIILALIFVPYWVGHLGFHHIDSPSVGTLWAYGMVYILLILLTLFIFIAALVKLVIPWVSTWGIK